MQKQSYRDILEGDLEEIQSYKEIQILARRTPNGDDRIEIRDLVNNTISVILPGERPVTEVLADINTVARNKLEKAKKTQGYVTLDAVRLTERLRESTKRLKTENRFREISTYPSEILNQIAFEQGFVIEGITQQGSKINAVLSKGDIRFVLSICIAEFLDVSKSIKTMGLIREEIREKIEEQIKSVEGIL